jgi:O-antigen ligase
VRVGGGVAAAHAALLLVVCPALPQPFSTPKLWVLALCAALLLATALWRGRAAARATPPALPALSLAWLAALFCSALAAPAPSVRAIALDAGAALLCFAVASGRGGVRGPLRALGLLGALEGLLVLAQAAGLDLLAPFAPHAAGRLQTYGTLGNPDFAAAWLGASVWLAAAEAHVARGLRARWAWLSALLVQVAALLLLRSFGSLLGLVAGALFAAAALRRSVRPLLGAVVLALCLLCAGLLARDPQRALAGRLHLWTTGLSALRAAPFLGYGPGSVALLQPAWEADRFERGEAGPAQRPYAGAQDHLHNDFLERALEQGPVGAAIFALLLAAGLAAALRGARTTSSEAAQVRFAALGAAAASLSARGLLDFPAARPAELALLVTLIALAARAAPRAAAARAPLPASSLPALGSNR